MKRCPTCSRVYDDLNLRFCLDDGTTLVNKLPEEQAPSTAVLSETATPTIAASTPGAPPVYRPAPTIASPRKVSPMLWVLGGGALFLTVAVIVVAVAFLLWNRPVLAWHLVLEVQPPSTANETAVVNQTVSVIESRLNAAGVSRFEVKPDGTRILVNLPAVKDPERIKNLISTGGKLELVHVISNLNPSPVQTYDTQEQALASLANNGGSQSNRRVLPFADRDNSSGPTPKKWVVVESPAIVDGADLRDAAAVKQSSGADYDITFALNKEGAYKFGGWTAANIDHYLGVVLNDEVKSIAFIKSQIVDRGVITGRFTKQAAEDLALVLRAGALPAPVRFVEERVDK